MSTRIRTAGYYLLSAVVCLGAAVLVNRGLYPDLWIPAVVAMALLWIAGNLMAGRVRRKSASQAVAG